jgi:DNA-binding response OmpR family regulator
MKTILVVDDHPDVRLMTQEFLTAEGYRVETAENGVRGLSLAYQIKPDLILLDIMMPLLNGFDFIREYRRNHNTPIILLTAKLEENDKVIGLELGADDYITKPFGMRELVSRVRAVLRRSTGESVSPRVLRIGELALDLEAHRVTVNGAEKHLTPSEFQLLAVLMASPGRAFSRAELLERVQDTTFVGVERTIDVHVRNLRAKIEPDPSQPTYIETVFGIGYRVNKQ